MCGTYYNFSKPLSLVHSDQWLSETIDNVQARKQNWENADEKCYMV